MMMEYSVAVVLDSDASASSLGRRTFFARGVEVEAFYEVIHLDALADLGDGVCCIGRSL